MQKKRSSKKPLLGNHQRCWIWGRHLVLETIKAGKWPIYELVFAKDLDRAELSAAMNLAEEKGISFGVEPKAKLTRRCGAADHQGYLAKMPPYPYDTRESLEKDWPGVPLFVVLDGIQDPFNFGAILRSVEVLGADAVVIGTRNQTEVTSQVARSSAGAVNHLCILRNDDLPRLLKDWKARGVRVFGTSEKSTSAIQDVNLADPLAIVIGNEGIGISPGIAAECDEFLAIPQTGRINSLNAAVSAGILLYEIKRQRETT